jgi:hypothetical protein
MDPIKAAIDATQPPAQHPVGPRAGVDITISSTGRQVRLEVPPDLTHAELLELIAWMTTGLRNATDEVRAAQAGGAPRPIELVVARGLPAS